MKKCRDAQSNHSFHDRFIYSRISTDFFEEFANRESVYADIQNDVYHKEGHSQNSMYKALMQSQLLGLKTSSENNYNNFASLKSTSSRFLPSLISSYRNQTQNNCYSLSPLCGLDETEIIESFHEKRVIPKVPYKVLDAPALQDDYYLDLVHWSNKNILAVGLGKSLYLWEASNSKITKLHEFDDNDFVASVAWSPKGNYLAVGSNKGFTKVWDYTSSKIILNAKTHKSRVGTISWNPNNYVLSTGSRDKSIVHRDVRVGKRTIINKSNGHKQEVCGLRWSPDGQYISSGGNDNKVMIWNEARLENPCLKFSEHKAAVKALSWSAYQNGLLATGGGTADKCIKLWDVTTGKSQGGIDTGSQVCNMIWGINKNELVTTHGYSKNSITVWKFNPLRSIAELTSHQSRVLYLAMSPDGQSIVTGSGDETLRFWQVFPPSASQLMKNQEWEVYPSKWDIR